MNSAELVNLIFEKLRRVKVVESNSAPSVRFTLRDREFTAVFQPTAAYDFWKNTLGEIRVFRFVRGRCDYDFVTARIEDILNGKVRNDAVEQPNE